MTGTGDRMALIEASFEPLDEKDPLWVRAGLMAEAPPPPISKTYGVYALDWLARLQAVVRTPAQQTIALLLYGKCLRQRGRTTVSLSNAELRQYGVSRYAKYRALALLREAGVIATDEGRNGRSVRITLLWFP
jgi:hypothetical protein